VKALPIALRRIARRAMRILGFSAFGALVVALASLAFLRTASGRGFLAAKVSAWVTRELVAELRIGQIEVLSSDRLVISGATLFDAKGRAVLRVHGVSARLDAITLLRNAFAGPSTRVDLPMVRVEQLEIGLYTTESGELSLIRAFDSQPQPVREKRSSTSNGGKGPFVHLPQVVVDRVSVRTDLSGLSQATAELRALKLNFDWSPELLALGFSSDDARVLRALPVEVTARLKTQIRVPGATEATLDGSVGAIPIQATLRALAGDLTLGLRCASLNPDAVRSLVPGWPLHAPVNVRAELSGHFPALQARVEADAGASRLEAYGPVVFSPNIQGKLTLTGRELDVRLVAPELAQSALSVDAQLAFSLQPEPHLDLTGRSLKGELFGAPLPEAALAVVYAGNEVSGTLQSRDPTLPVSVDFGVSKQGKLSFHGRAPSLGLSALAPYGLHALGQVDIDTTGELVQGQLAAAFEARLASFDRQPVHAQTTLVRGKLHGATDRLGQLGLELEARGANLSLGAVKFPAWAIESQGSLERQVVSVRAGPESKPTLQAATTLAFQQGLSFGETRLEAEINGVKHALELKSARLAAQLIALRGLRWQMGAGKLSGSLLLGATHQRAELDAQGLDVEAMLKTLGRDSAIARGRLDVSLQLEQDARGRQGQLKARLLDGVFPSLGVVQAEFSASAVGPELEGQGTIEAPALGQAKLSGRAELVKGPLDLESLARLAGELRFEVSHVDLAEVSRRWFPSAGLALSGFGQATVRLAKADERTPATASYELKTRELALRSRRAGGEGRLLHAELSSDGEVNASETTLRLDLNDAAGPWLNARATARLGMADLVQVFGAPAALLWDAPLHVELAALPRSLELLGAELPRALSGEVAAKLSVRGSARRPEFEGTLNATGIGPGVREPRGKLALAFDYSAPREQYSVSAHYVEQSRDEFEFVGGGHWGWFEHGFGRDWSARGEGRIEGIALGPLGDLFGVPVSGKAAGHAVLNASASEFETKMELDLEQLALDREPLGSGQLQLSVQRGLAQAQLNVARASATLDFAGEVGLCWDGGPCIDAERGGNVDAKVRNYQLAALAPLLRSVASDIRGALNGFVTLAWGPADGTGQRNTKVRADAIVSDGSVTLSAGAGSVQCANLAATADGKNTLRMTLRGCARSNRPNLTASADVRFNGPVPRSVAAKLSGKEIPVSFEGVMLGTATIPDAQPMQLKLDLSAARRAVETSIPALDFQLPTSDDTRLVELAEDPAIRVTDEKAPPKISEDAEDSTPWSISVRLGGAVSIKQPGMRVPITGTLTQSPDGLLEGTIFLPEGGVVPQLGQLFRLKRGSVHFDHQPLKAGVLNIEAATRTADGVVVDLYVSGTIEKPVIRLRSDPPRSENDIVALLLGLQASDTATTNGQQGADLRSSATALAMNQLLRGSPLAGLQFGAGQTHQGDSVSTVSVRAGNTVWLEGRTVRSTTQRAASSGVQSSGVIDWRFARGFSLRTQLGNISGLELRWSHRY